MTNLAFSFLLELCLLAALCYWGFHTGSGTITGVFLGIGAPLLVAVFWGIFLAPRAVVRLQDTLRLLLKIIVFATGVAALFASGQPALAWALGIGVVINFVLAYTWKQ